MASSGTNRDSAGDRAHMTAALALARRALGNAAPNPAVGCVLVRAGRVIGRGWTQPGGRPHAETEALSRARRAMGAEAAAGATAYVSLEPCAHVGKTPPCADALIGARIARCVVALEDPDPRVAGEGLARLREAGISIELGLGAEEAAEINAGYLTRLRLRRPLVTLKIASSLDGRIATAGGESRWITGSAARAHGHLMRARHDAVMVGSGTARADDPRLDVRLPGMAGHNPIRVVLDGRARLAADSDLVTRAGEQATLLVTGEDVEEARLAAFRAAGLDVEGVARGKDGKLDLGAVMAALAVRGIGNLLVESGGSLAAALFARELVDRLLWYRAPLVIGGDGLASVAALDVRRMADSWRFHSLGIATLGKDSLEILAREQEGAV